VSVLTRLNIAKPNPNNTMASAIQGGTMSDMILANADTNAAIDLFMNLRKWSSLNMSSRPPTDVTISKTWSSVLSMKPTASVTGTQSTQLMSITFPGSDAHALKRPSLYIAYD
jgi:hypothetical protein